MTCIWQQEGECSDGWDTSCKRAFRIDDGTPAENGMKFCCFCGNPIEESQWNEARDGQ